MVVNSSMDSNINNPSTTQSINKLPNSNPDLILQSSK